MKSGQQTRVASRRLSEIEYVSLEQRTGLKHEFHDGRVYALAGGSFVHGVICGNLFGELRDRFNRMGKNCRPFMSDIKVYLKASNSYVYPDATVVCGAPKHPEELPEAVANPILIVEVLSKSTAAYDRGEKFNHYRKIESLQTYLLIEQDSAAVEIYERRGDLWKIDNYEGRKAQAVIESLNMTIELAEIYRDVEFPPGEQLTPPPDDLGEVNMAEK